MLQINSFPMYLSSTVRSWEHLISVYQYFIQAVRSTATQFQLITPASSGCWGRRKHEWRRCVGSVSGTDPPGGSRGWVLVTAIVPTGTVVPPTLLPWPSIGVGVLWQRGLLLLASPQPAVLGVLHARGVWGPPIPPGPSPGVVQPQPH